MNHAHTRFGLAKHQVIFTVAPVFSTLAVEVPASSKQTPPRNHTMKTSGSTMSKSILAHAALALAWWALSLEGVRADGPSSSGANIKFKYIHSWTNKQNLPGPRSDLTATPVEDLIVLAGGCDAPTQHYITTSWGGMYACPRITNNTLLYSPALDTYTPAPNMPRKRYRHAATSVGTKVYVLGGTNLAEEQLTHVDVFDASTRTWSTLASQPLAEATTDPAAFSIGTKIYFTGGYVLPNYITVNTTWMMDTANVGAGWTKVAPAPSQRGDHAAVAIHGKAYVFGGFTHLDNYAQALSTLESYDPTKDTWTMRASMSNVRGDKAGTVLHDRFQCIGGEQKTKEGVSVPLSDVEAYDPAMDRWIPEGHIPSKRFRFVAASHEDTIYIFGGQGYLVGTANTNTSYYPLVTTVEALLETKVTIDVSGAARRGDTGKRGALLVLSMLSAILLRQ